MREVAVDFGTSNTVIARHNEITGRTETLEIPGITTEMSYRLTPHGEEHIVYVIPSLIHYSETETLIGDQVLSQGLAEHPDTIRWMKRSIAWGMTARKRTAQGHKSPAEAGEDFLRRLLFYMSDRISLEEDPITFTVPVEKFEDFQDWLLRLCESMNIRRARLIDEPSACIFGYQGEARDEERFVIFDFGGGTLDVSAIRLTRSPDGGRKAIELGKAGCDLGGMDIDLWLTEDFSERHRLSDYEKRELKAVILRQAETVKIRLSDPEAASGEALAVLDDLGRAPRSLQTTYVQGCPECKPGLTRTPLMPGEVCLGCLLSSRGFIVRIRETLDRALENAAVKVGMRRGDVTKLLVTGGTSLVPAVRRLLEDAFGSRVVYDHPFDAVVRGACRGSVDPVLLHDYTIESYSRERREYEFLPLFPLGTEYPTHPDKPVRFWITGSHEGQTRIGLKIYEVSRLGRRALDNPIVNQLGRLQEACRVACDYEHICLNLANPTFILADPPVNLTRDRKRFLASYAVDGNRRLLVTVLDNMTGKILFQDHPVVRL